MNQESESKTDGNKHVTLKMELLNDTLQSGNKLMLAGQCLVLTLQGKCRGHLGAKVHELSCE